MKSISSEIASRLLKSVASIAADAFRASSTREGAKSRPRSGANNPPPGIGVSGMDVSTSFNATARRARAVARPRQVAMFLAKSLTSKSLPEIGRGFGGRDHTTVIHAVRKVEQLRETDSQLADDIELLRRMLEG